MKTKNIYYGGADESGKGDDFGPLILCVVMGDNKISSILTRLNVKDSKLFSNIEIIELAQKIISALPESSFQIMMVKPNTINRMRTAKKNLSQIMVECYLKLFNDFFAHSDNAHFLKGQKEIIVDKFPFKAEYHTLFTKNNFNATISFLEHAESKSIFVSAASVLARYEFLRRMNIQSEKLNYALPLGANFIKNVIPFIQYLKYGRHFSYDDA